jgi:hypothetical protein
MVDKTVDIVNYYELHGALEWHIPSRRLGEPIRHTYVGFYKIPVEWM